MPFWVLSQLSQGFLELRLEQFLGREPTEGLGCLMNGAITKLAGHNSQGESLSQFFALWVSYRRFLVKDCLFKWGDRHSREQLGCGSYTNYFPNHILSLYLITPNYYWGYVYIWSTKFISVRLATVKMSSFTIQLFYKKKNHNFWFFHD